MENPESDLKPSDTSVAAPSALSDFCGSLFGTASSVLGALSVLDQIRSHDSPGRLIAGGALLVGGLAILPPVTKTLRSKIQRLRHPFAPPLAYIVTAAFGFFIADFAFPRDSETFVVANVAAKSAVVAQAAPKVGPAPKAEVRDQASDFISLVDSSYLPQVANLSLSEPDSVDEIWKRENQIEVLATFLDGQRVPNVIEGDASGAAKKEVQALVAAKKRFHSALSAKQAKLYPVLRRAYIKLIANKVWADNVIVSGRDRHIIYTSAMFASNSNIQTAYENLAFDLRKLRFKRASFPWYEGSRAYYYNLDVPSDSSFGRASGRPLRTKW